MDFRDLALRAVKTFVQAFLAVFIAAGTDYVNVSTVKAAAIAAGAAVFSAVYNAVAQSDSNALPY